MIGPIPLVAMICATIRIYMCVCFEFHVRVHHVMMLGCRFMWWDISQMAHYVHIFHKVHYISSRIAWNKEFDHLGLLPESGIKGSISNDSTPSILT